MICPKCNGLGKLEIKLRDGFVTACCPSCEGSGILRESILGDDSSKDAAAVSNAPSGHAVPCTMIEADVLKDKFFEMIKPLFEGQESDVIMALLLDILLRVHLTTSAPEYTDEMFIEYVVAVTRIYRKAYNGRHN